MKTIILAAGYATRLYPLTENYPKPLLEIGNNTILGRLLDDLDGPGDGDSVSPNDDHGVERMLDASEKRIGRAHQTGGVD